MRKKNWMRQRWGGLRHKRGSRRSRASRFAVEGCTILPVTGRASFFANGCWRTEPRPSCIRLGLPSVQHCQGRGFSAVATPLWFPLLKAQQRPTSCEKIVNCTFSSPTPIFLPNCTNVRRSSTLITHFIEHTVEANAC